MKNLKSLKEFFDSTDIRDNLYNYNPQHIEKSLKSPLNRTLTQLIGSVDRLREFESEFQNNMIIFTNTIGKDVYKVFVMPSEDGKKYNCYFNKNTLQLDKEENVSIGEVIAFIGDTIKTNI